MLHQGERKESRIEGMSRGNQTGIRTTDGRRLRLYEWAIPEPRAAVGIVHGYCEHCGRYLHVARALNESALSVYGVDLRGHGQSGGPPACIRRFEDYHRDVDALVGAMRQRAPGAPLALLSHSLGGLIVLDWLSAGNDDTLCGAALSSPLLAIEARPRAMLSAIGQLLSVLAPGACLASTVQPSDLSRDPEVVRSYRDDPAISRVANARWFTESRRAMERVRDRAGMLRTPLLILYAGADRVASADATEAFVQRLVHPEQEGERLRGYYHEILNEPEPARSEVLQRFAAWISRRAAPGGGGHTRCPR